MTRQLVGTNIQLFRSIDNFVVDVRDITHECDLIAGKTQVALNHVPDYGHTCVTQVAGVVYGRTASVKFDLARFHGDKFFFLACQCIE